MTGLSLYAQRCMNYGLDPETTSEVKLASVQRGITDRILSVFEISCMDSGLKPEETSFAKLASMQLGVQDRVLPLSEIENQLGKNWVSHTCSLSVR